MTVIATLTSPVPIITGSGDDLGGYTVEVALPPGVAGNEVSSAVIDAVYSWFDAEPTAWRVYMYQSGGGIQLESALEGSSNPLPHDPVVTATLTPAASIGMGTNGPAMSGTVTIVFDTNASYGIGPVDGLGNALITVTFNGTPPPPGPEPHPNPLPEYRVQAGPVTGEGVVTDPRMSVVVPSYVSLPALRWPRPPGPDDAPPDGAMRLRGAWDVATAYEAGDVMTFEGGTYFAVASSTGDPPFGIAAATGPAVEDWVLNGDASLPSTGRIRFNPDGSGLRGNAVMPGLINLSLGDVVIDFDAGGSGADGYSVGFVPSTASLGDAGGYVALIGTDGFGLKFSSYESNARWLNDIPGQETSNAYLGGTDFNTAQSYRATFTKSGSTVTARLQRLTGTTFDETHAIPGLVITSTWYLALGGASGGISGTHWAEAVSVSYFGQTASAAWEQIGVTLW